MICIRSIRHAALVCLLLLMSSHVLAQNVDIDQDFPVLSYYDEILAKEPRNATALRERGVAYYHQGDFEKAIADFNQALTLNTKDVAAYTGRGVSQLKKGDLDDAAADLQRAIRLSPNSAAIYHHLVDVYWYKDDWDNVISNATQIIRVNPSESAWACDVRGTAWQNKGDLDRAQKEFATAIRLRPDWDAPYRDRGEALNKKGDFNGAMTDLNEAVRLDPHNEQNYNARAEIYRGKGDWDALIANWTEAIANNPTNIAYLNARGFEYQIHKKDFAKAIADYNKRAELKPNEPYVYLSRGYAYERESLYDKAITDFSKAIQLNPTSSIYPVIRANSYFKNGQYQEARKNFDQAIQINPTNSFGYVELAYFLATCPDASFRNGEEALQMARKGCNLDKQEDYCAYALAVAYAEHGDFDEAIRYQKQYLDNLLKTSNVSDEAIKKMKESLALFEQHKPYREPVKSKAKP